MAQQDNIVGKEKIVVDATSYAQVPRSSTDLSRYDPQYIDQVIGITNLSNLRLGDFKKDFARIALGKYWDLARQNENTEKESFGNNWRPLRYFYNHKIQLEHCADVSFELDSNKKSTVEKISFYCDLNEIGESSLGLPEAQAERHSGGYFSWLAAVKTGVIKSNGDFVPPLIDTSQDFFDHYYVTSRPFTPKEQLQFNMTGPNISIANYKTYYNERINSADYETAIANRNELNNSLPSVYGFLRIIAGQEILEGDTNYLAGQQAKYNQTIGAIKKFYDKGDLLADYSEINKPGADAINNILFHYPFETLVTLYGSIGSVDYDIAKTTKIEKTSNIINKILSAPYDSTTAFNPYKKRPKPTGVDIDGLFESYINEYTFRLTTDNKFNNDFAFNKKFQFLEKCMMNVLFDPNIIPIMNKVDKYKNYFPFYNEIEFSTEKNTSSTAKGGDVSISKLIKEYNLHNLFMYHLASSLSKQREDSSLPYKNITNKFDESGASTSPTTKIIINPVTGEQTIVEEDTIFDSIDTKVQDPATQKFDYAVPYRFFDLNSTPVKQNIDDGSPVNIPAQQPVQDIKQIIDVIEMLDKFIEIEDYFDDYNTDTYDIRNFLCQLQSESDKGFFEIISTMLTGDMDNVYNKNINVPALKENILKIYEGTKRSYKDILDGKPAHTEDLFYSVTKYIIRNDGSETPIQNVFFPNIDDTNIMKYIDTQVKYGNVAKYKYIVHAHRIVFGSKYRYQWTAPHPDVLAGITPDINSDDYTDLSIFLPSIGALQAGFALPEDLQGPYSPVELTEDLQSLAEGVKISFGNAEGPGLGPQGLAMTLGGLGLMADNAIGTQNDNYFTHFSATLRVKVEPSIKLIADKVFETPVMTILDKPPIPPQVNIVPYRAVNSKIKILLDGSVDRYRQEPISLLESDQIQFQTIKDAQLTPDGKIEFGSDDPISSFQIFRSEVHPESYGDFEFYATVNGSVYEETILPNKKYYYTFRSIDSHGHISNPSEIYLVELVDMQGAVRPIIRTVPLLVPELENPRIELNKYLYISPSTIQLFNSDNSDVDSIFSSKDVKKKYKIRLTSKTSGKKIDVNLAFEKKEEKVLVSAEKIPVQGTAATNTIQTVDQANQLSLTPGGNQGGSSQSDGGYTPSSGGIVGNTGMPSGPTPGGMGNVSPSGGASGGGGSGGY